MSVTFCVWNAVIYLSTAEPKSAMHNGDQGNRGIGNREWSGVEWNRAEWSGIRIIKIKIKENAISSHGTVFFAHCMSDTSCVWYAVIYLSTVELKGTMCNGNQDNRGGRCQGWSRIR